MTYIFIKRRSIHFSVGKPCAVKIQKNNNEKIKNNSKQTNKPTNIYSIHTYNQNTQITLLAPPRREHTFEISWNLFLLIVFFRKAFTMNVQEIEHCHYKGWPFKSLLVRVRV